MGVLAFLSKNAEESKEKWHKELQLSVPLQLTPEKYIQNTYKK